ncbi:hypothetical protein [Sinomonas atrocyanea]|uniref:hypothetical protein n=1 Tax=Sinomonas atrocyanea TaxID=37927 RepID=UPI003D958CD0
MEVGADADERDRDDAEDVPSRIGPPMQAATSFLWNRVKRASSMAAWMSIELLLVRMPSVGGLMTI